MKLKLYQVDAFAGNPAAVMPLKQWLPDELMQKIAMENNLSETAFFVPAKNSDADFELRWFTPMSEINLCGHATLASSFVVFQILKVKKKKVVFETQSGLLTVYNKSEKKNYKALMDFPAWKPEPFNDYPAGLQQALGVNKMTGVYKHRDLLVELADEDDVKNVTPDFGALKKIAGKVIITARGNEVDFVSRFFGPGVGVDEDPVTGSAHSQLIPFWSEKLNKTKMKALQLSQRGGEIDCEYKGDRVMMGGSCVFFMKGECKL
ncbi:MAG: isomerase [Chitinophagaceae bacterium]